MSSEENTAVDSPASKYLPTGESWIRATVSAIPFVGGALDHLLFDKADEIRKRNIESSLDALSRKLEDIEESNVDKDWFNSEEALQVFRLLAETSQFEPSEPKRSVLGEIVAVSGTQKHSSDGRTLSVLEHLGRLSFVQIKLLKIVGSMKPKEREFSGGSISQKGTAYWLDDILEVVKANPGGQFWTGTLQLDVELELMESLNIFRRAPIFSGGATGYFLTSIGKLVLSYLEDTDV